MSQAEAVTHGAAVAATTVPVFQPREWTLLGFAEIKNVDQDLALRVSVNGSPTMHRLAAALANPSVMDAYELSFVQASYLGQLVEKWREHREETAESKLSARRRLERYMRDVMDMDMDEARRPRVFPGQSVTLGMSAQGWLEMHDDSSSRPNKALQWVFGFFHRHVKSLFSLFEPDMQEALGSVREGKRERWKDGVG